MRYILHDQAGKVMQRACKGKATMLFVCLVGSLRIPQATPVREVVPVAATDSGVIWGAQGIHELSDGTVIVNDGGRRRLLAFDSTLRRFTVILDTSGGPGNKYGDQFATILPYFSDSTVFVDRVSRAFVLLTPHGEIARVIAPPRASDLQWIMSSAYGKPGFDLAGHLVYMSRLPMPPDVGTLLPDSLGRPRTFVVPDSAPILRSEFGRSTVDTIGYSSIAEKRIAVFRAPNGGVGRIPAFNPLPTPDAWALLPNGVVGIVRGHDYHVDWIFPDGRSISSPKLPFAWRRITLEEKQRLIDSLRSVAAADSIRDARAAAGPVQGAPVPFITVEARDLPDYYPAIRAGYVQADAEGNLWILPATSESATPGSGLMWDVVNQHGELAERVRLPPGRNLVGFGRRGTVYLSYQHGRNDIRLERARVVR